MNVTTRIEALGHHYNIHCVKRNSRNLITRIEQCDYSTLERLSTPYYFQLGYYRSLAHIIGEVTPTFSDYDISVRPTWINYNVVSFTSPPTHSSLAFDYEQSYCGANYVGRNQTVISSDPFIQSGEPTQNAFVESFNGKIRDSCLNLQRFRDLIVARKIIDQWRSHYSTERPHISLCNPPIYN